MFSVFSFRIKLFYKRNQITGMRKIFARSFSFHFITTQRKNIFYSSILKLFKTKLSVIFCHIDSRHMNYRLNFTFILNTFCNCKSVVTIFAATSSKCYRNKIRSQIPKFI